MPPDRETQSPERLRPTSTDAHHDHDAEHDPAIARRASRTALQGKAPPEQATKEQAASLHREAASGTHEAARMALILGETRIRKLADEIDTILPDVSANPTRQDARGATGLRETFVAMYRTAEQELERLTAMMNEQEGPKAKAALERYVEKVAGAVRHFNNQLARVEPYFARHSEILALDRELLHAKSLRLNDASGMKSERFDLTSNKLDERAVVIESIKADLIAANLCAASMHEGSARGDKMEVGGDIRRLVDHLAHADSELGHIAASTTRRQFAAYTDPVLAKLKLILADQTHGSSPYLPAIAKHATSIAAKVGAKQAWR